jgi:hypothetical protein
MNALSFVLSLRPAVPMSIERPCEPASNREVRRWMRDGAVLINAQRVLPDAQIERDDVRSLVFFPKSTARRTTVI